MRACYACAWRRPKRKRLQHCQVTAYRCAQLYIPGLASPARCSASPLRRSRFWAVLISAMWENACGKVADQPLGGCVILLRQQTQVVAQSNQALEQAAPLVLPSEQHHRVRKPEGAGRERALAVGKAVFDLGRVMMHDEAVLEQPALDGAHGASDTRVVYRQKARARDQQQAAVEPFRALGLHEAAEFRVVAIGAHVVMDLNAPLGIPPRDHCYDRQGGWRKAEVFLAG